MKKTSEFILSELKWGAFVAPVGSKWLHKKGGRYRVVGHSFDTERGDVAIIYVRTAGPEYDQSVDPHIPYNRPATLWTEDRFQKLPD